MCSPGETEPLPSVHRVQCYLRYMLLSRNYQNIKTICEWYQYTYWLWICICDDISRYGSRSQAVVACQNWYVQVSNRLSRVKPCKDTVKYHPFHSHYFSSLPYSFVTRSPLNNNLSTGARSGPLYLALLLVLDW